MKQAQAVEPAKPKAKVRSAHRPSCIIFRAHTLSLEGTVIHGASRLAQPMTACPCSMATKTCSIPARLSPDARSDGFSTCVTTSRKPCALAETTVGQGVRSVEPGNRVRAVDRLVWKAGSASGLGGVFGDVVRHRLGRQRSTGVDDPGVDLGPEPQDTPQVWVCGGASPRVVADDCRACRMAWESIVALYRAGGGWQSMAAASSRTMAW
jgi:hypothetical protein